MTRPMCPGCGSLSPGTQRPDPEQLPVIVFCKDIWHFAWRYQWWSKGRWPSRSFNANGYRPRRLPTYRVDWDA